MTQKAILYGLPVVITDDGCEPANWFAALLLDPMVSMFGFNGALMVYEGSYWTALWAWLRGGEA